MRTKYFNSLTLLAAFAFSAAANGAQATSVVEVDLVDPSTDPAIKDMHMKLDRVSSPAGPVTFQVRNESKTLVHELIVIEDTGPLASLPYDAKKDVASEDKISSLGEVPELPPGKSGSLTVTMKPGSYVLICNQAGHLHNGMWARFQVTVR